MNEASEPHRCDVLILIATPTEEKELKSAAKSMGVAFDRKTVEDTGEYFHLGLIGSSGVNAVRTELGPLSHGGSASRAIHWQIKTGATAIVQLGMAFGVDPTQQKIGDVLVSTSLVPYDLRDVRSPGSIPVVMPLGAIEIDGSMDDTTSLGPVSSDQSNRPESSQPAARYVVDYHRAERHPAKESLVRLFTEEYQREPRDHQVYFGGILSGGARIFSRQFLRELMDGVPQSEDGIVGGEMEGVGLLSVSPRTNPIWVVVKGISDFADEDRDRIIKETRSIACKHSARFVLSALQNARTE